MSIFGAAFDASTGRWIAFNEETLASLSEHHTAVETLEACRRYREMQRTKKLLCPLVRERSASMTPNHSAKKGSKVRC
jgi:hypothetical protein